MSVIFLFCSAIVGLYIVALFWLIWHWKSMQATPIAAENKLFVSLVCVFRNEEKNLGILLQSLQNQHYSHTNFEVIFCNDASSDQGADLIRHFAKKSNLNIHLVENTEKIEALSPKKRFMQQAVQIAKGEIILSTDADCHMGPDWIASMVAPFERKEVMLVSGPVLLDGKPNLFNYLQQVEFASLIASGAACMHAQVPNMCNAANMAFRKAAFEAVHGYEGFEQIPSGDDEFLMHKIFKAFPGGVHFQKSKHALVKTQPHEQLGAFLQQRIRWASKWPYYTLWHIKVVAFFVALVQMAQLFMLGYAFYYQKFDGYFMFLIFKLVVEAYFLADALKFFDKFWSIIFIPITQIFYPFYVILVALFSLKGSYQWKGRTYKAS